MNSKILTHVQFISAHLVERKETVSVAESCTGGLLGAALTELSGSSTYFLGGIQAYSNITKSGVLGVASESISSFGAVSEKVASEMALGVIKLMGSNWGLSITGVAGPTGGTVTNPVGTVWVAIADQSGVHSQKLSLIGSRLDIRQKAVSSALEIFIQHLSQRNKTS